MRERKKENELLFFRKLTLLKSKISRCFLLLSLQEPLIRSNLDTYFLGEIVMSQRFWITWISAKKQRLNMVLGVNCQYLDNLV